MITFQFRWISDGDTSHCEWRRNLNLTPANLSLQCDSPGQSKPRSQTSSPAVAGAISPSIIDVHFRYGVVLNSHSTRVVELVGCASRSNRDKQADGAYEAVAIAIHTRSQQRLLEGLKSAAKVATIHRLERRGKPKGNVVPSPVYEHRNWHPTSPGTRRAFGCLIDSSYTTILPRLLPVRARRQGGTFVKSDGCQLVLRGTRIAALKSLPR